MKSNEGLFEKEIIMMIANDNYVNLYIVHDLSFFLNFNILFEIEAMLKKRFSFLLISSS